MRSQLVLQLNALIGRSRQRGSDDRMPEERGEKSNHNNAKDNTPRVESRGGVVAGGQPSWSSSLMPAFLGRPASEPTSPDIHKDFLNRLAADAGRRIAARMAACRTLTP